MIHSCPHCGVSLKWKLVKSKPLPGERKILPNQAIPVCSSCGGGMVSNTHWSEAVAAIILFLSVWAFLALRSTFSRVGAIWLGVAILAIWVATYVFFYFRYWRHWQRYKACEPSQQK